MAKPAFRTLVPNPTNLTQNYKFKRCFIWIIKKKNKKFLTLGKTRFKISKHTMDCELEHPEYTPFTSMIKYFDEEMVKPYVPYVPDSEYSSDDEEYSEFDKAIDIGRQFHATKQAEVLRYVIDNTIKEYIISEEELSAENDILNRLHTMYSGIVNGVKNKMTLLMKEDHDKLYFNKNKEEYSTKEKIEKFRLLDIYPAQSSYYVSKDGKKLYFLGEGEYHDEYQMCPPLFEFGSYILIAPMNMKKNYKNNKATMFSVVEENANCSLMSYKGIWFIISTSIIEKGEPLTIDRGNYHRSLTRVLDCDLTHL